MQFALFKTVQEMERLFLFTGANILFSSTSTLLIFLKEAFLFKGLLKFVEKFIIVSHYMNIEIRLFQKTYILERKKNVSSVCLLYLSKKHIQDVFKLLLLFSLYMLWNYFFENHTWLRRFCQFPWATFAFIWNIKISNAIRWPLKICRFYKLRFYKS